DLDRAGDDPVAEGLHVHVMSYASRDERSPPRRGSIRPWALGAGTPSKQKALCAPWGDRHESSGPYVHRGTDRTPAGRTASPRGISASGARTRLRDLVE